ncbi:MAG: hypothetical protein Q8L53_06305 [Aestuariivirga sp.]|nr:hypothetical protein [Aestuariivirga sp.]
MFRGEIEALPPDIADHSISYGRDAPDDHFVAANNTKDFNHFRLLSEAAS